MLRRHRSLHARLAVSQLHNCGAVWRATVPVHEVFRGETVWQGDVEVFDLSNHPKAKRAYAWSHLDGKRVSALQGTLGKKKIRLLTQAEAPGLVQKYTALAETAWISKLAQAILCIYFGWPFALDEERRRKITVITYAAHFSGISC